MPTSPLPAAPGPRALLVAWAGLVLFMISLNGCFVVFLWGMRGNAPAGSSVFTSAVINVGLFSIFAAHHSLLARSGAKRWVTARVPANLERSCYVWIASLLLIAVWLGWRELPGALYRHDGGLAVLHWLVVIAGFALTLRASAVLDPLELGGVRQAAGTDAHQAFKIEGPYHLVRHPIYLGWLLIVFGVPQMTWTRFEFAVVSSAYLVVAIPFEERSLVEAFGDTYRRYQTTVRWRMVPGIW
jgi:methanethiol S-methyltransferase